MSKENTAVFIGHNECYGVTSEQIKEAIVSLIDKGVTEFLSGGQGGFDRLCGRCVYEWLIFMPSGVLTFSRPFAILSFYRKQLRVIFDYLIFQSVFFRKKIGF